MTRILQPEADDEAIIAAAIEVALRNNPEHLTIGVTGHRWNRITGMAAKTLSNALAGVFAAISNAGHGVPVSLATGMAEGADLAAALARPTGWALVALLPLSPKHWRAHLAANATGDPDQAVAALDAALSGDAVSVDVLPLSADGGPDYAKLAQVLVGRSDLLIAVWDGKPGLPGGTGSVVVLARARGIPILRLWPDNAGKWRVQKVA